MISRLVNIAKLVYLVGVVLVTFAFMLGLVPLVPYMVGMLPFFVLALMGVYNDVFQPF